MLERLELPIAPHDTATMLFERLAEQGAPLLVSTLAGLQKGTLHPQPQNHALATHAPILTRDHGRVQWTAPAQAIYDRWRGFQPWPGAWSTLGGKKFTLKHIAPAQAQTAHAPGKLFVEDAQLYAACGEGSVLQLIEVQIEGKRAMPAAEFLRGNAQAVGAQLD